MPRNSSASTTPRTNASAKAGKAASAPWATAAATRARPNAATLSSLGMMNRRASIAAIATMMTARSAPSAPRRSGAIARLAVMPTIAAQPIVVSTDNGGASTSCWSSLGARGRYALRGVSCSMSAQLGGHRSARRRRARRAAQLRAQLLGDEMGIDAVADDLRPDENDQLGALEAVGLLRECAAERVGKLAEQGDAARAALLALADKTGEQHGLAAHHRDRALDPALRHGRRQGRAGARLRGDVADLLLDVEPHVAVDVDARNDAQDDAGVAIIDSVDDGVAGGQHRRAAGRDRHLVADLQRGRLVVDDDDRRIRQH